MGAFRSITPSSMASSTGEPVEGGVSSALGKVKRTMPDDKPLLETKGEGKEADMTSSDTTLGGRGDSSGELWNRFLSSKRAVLFTLLGVVAVLLALEWFVPGAATRLPGR